MSLQSLEFPPKKVIYVPEHGHPFFPALIYDSQTFSKHLFSFRWEKKNMMKKKNSLCNDCSKLKKNKQKKPKEKQKTVTTLLFRMRAPQCAREIGTHV